MTTEDEQTYAIYRQITTILGLGNPERPPALNQQEIREAEFFAADMAMCAIEELGRDVIGAVIASATFCVSRSLARHGYRIVEK